jgi:hypothetical protein
VYASTTISLAMRCSRAGSVEALRSALTRPAATGARYSKHVFRAAHRVILDGNRGTDLRELVIPQHMPERSHAAEAIEIRSDLLRRKEPLDLRDQHRELLPPFRSPLRHP